MEQTINIDKNGRGEVELFDVTRGRIRNISTGRRRATVTLEFEGAENTRILVTDAKPKSKLTVSYDIIEF